MQRPSSGLATDFHWLCKSLLVFHQDFSKIVTLPIAMLKTIRSSIVSASRVDDNEIVGGCSGIEAENGGSIVKQKVGSIIPDNWLNSQGGSYKSLQQVCDFAAVFSLDLASKLSKHTRINNHVIKLIKCQRAHQTIQINRRYSHAFQTKFGQILSVVRLETQ